MSFTLIDVLGVSGSALYLYSYVLLQMRRDFAITFTYSFMNFAAAILVLCSLYQHFNLAAVICNLSWGAISIYGMYRSRKRIKQPLENLETMVEETIAAVVKEPNIP